MKTIKSTTTWPTLDKLPPSIVFQTVAFLQDESTAKHHEVLRQLVVSVEKAAQIDLSAFVAPSSSAVKVTADQVQRLVAGFAAFISIVEHGAIELGLQGLGAADLQARYRAARSEALAKTKSIQAVLVASLENAFGALRNETPEDRLARSVASARETEPFFVGSFAQFADDEDDEG
jgi:hypothetical protein